MSDAQPPRPHPPDPESSKASRTGPRAVAGRNGSASPEPSSPVSSPIWPRTSSTRCRWSSSSLHLLVWRSWMSETLVKLFPGQDLLPHQRSRMDQLIRAFSPVGSGDAWLNFHAPVASHMTCDRLGSAPERCGPLLFRSPPWTGISGTPPCGSGDNGRPGLHELWNQGSAFHSAMWR